MRRVFALALLIVACTAWAEDADIDALSLSGSPPQETASNSQVQFFAEGAAGSSDASGTSRALQRLSLGLDVEYAFSTQLRGILSDRLDVLWQDAFGQSQKVNTLKEAYLNWQPNNNVVIDAGRINQYSGVAIGYNPTDFFRDNALRSLVSIDPAILKTNRQGSVMLRGQVLWDGGALTALYSPKLGDDSSSAPFSPDWAATNHRDRAMFIYSQRISADFSPQWLLLLDEGHEPQLGLNLTRLVNNSTVAYLEWSGGRSQSLLAQALGQTESAVFRNRVATGFTYTTTNELSLTLEYEYNGAGLRQREWNALPYQSLVAYQRYREFTQSAQELPTHSATFLYAKWQNVLINHLDLAAMVRRDNDDYSRLYWFETRYHWSHDEVALQLQTHGGGLLSNYGTTAVGKTWQMLYRHFF